LARRFIFFADCRSTRNSIMLKKIIVGRGGTARSTRFHDENNTFMGIAEFRHAPHAFWTALARKYFHREPVLPKWPYPAIAAIEKLLTPSAVVLEYGIGMSTLWLAPRVKAVHGIEGAPEWVAAITQELAKRGLANVSLHLRDSTAYPERGRHSDAFNRQFASLDGIAAPRFDFIEVDGAARWLCVEQGLNVLKPGGALYLDDSDADKDWAHYTAPGQAREARNILLRAQASGLGSCTFFRGFSPSSFAASEGLLFRKRA
jgi:SAM-dependent methyltransferase